MHSAVRSTSPSACSMSSTANSSPPMRPMSPRSPTHPCNRAAPCTSSSSPAACPSESLTSLNRSKSTSSKASPEPHSSALPQALWSISSNMARFGSPVRGSWRACARAVLVENRSSIRFSNWNSRTSFCTMSVPICSASRPTDAGTDGSFVYRNKARTCSASPQTMSLTIRVMSLRQAS